jgi:hypothetical protein
MEQGKSYKDANGKAQAGQTPVRLNTDDFYETGLSHSTEEASVMAVERRGTAKYKDCENGRIRPGRVLT